MQREKKGKIMRATGKIYHAEIWEIYSWIFFFNTRLELPINEHHDGSELRGFEDN